MKRIFGCIGLVCMLLLSCNREGLDERRDNLLSALNVTLSLHNLGAEVATRANVDPVRDEQEVHSLYLYFFEASESKTGVFVDYIKLNGPLAMNSTYTLPTSGTGISVTESYHIIAIANIDDNRYISGGVNTWSALWNGRTEAYFRTNALADISGVSSDTDNSKAIDSGWILMNGSTKKQAMSSDIAITLTRNLARFDVINNADAAYDLVSASIWNAYSRSSITGDGVPDYSTTPGLRTNRFYGVMNEMTGAEFSREIKGGLYAFENWVGAPAPGDQYTTCLVLGLSNRASGETSYYRVNVHPNESPQKLKRNNAYKVTISGVNGVGAETEADAYAGKHNELNFTINNWDLDDNGMVVSDMNSILAVPIKTVKIGSTGGDFTYHITTFSSLNAPAPLSVKSQMYDPSTGKISASLNGSALTIHAQPLAPEEEDRTGVVTVTFAGLETSIHVVQSFFADIYLNVTLEDTWSPTLGSTDGHLSEYIYVKASGSWTAELFGDDGFSFRSGTGVPAKTTLISAEAPTDKFRVYTHSANEDGKIRKAFILISLDQDPVNYVSAVPVYQKQVGTITINPEVDVITFDGNGHLTSHPASQTFEVEGTVNPISQFVLSGIDTDRFTVNSPTGNSPEALVVETVGFNTSGNPYTATLHITDTSGAEKIIALRQSSLHISVMPTAPGKVVVTGGQTDLITVSTEVPSLEWTATISTSSTTPGKTLYNHEAYLVDENGDVLDASHPQSVATKFRVVFPKVYFPNKEINIAAAVTIQITGSSLTQTITVNQTALTSNGVKIFNVKYGGTNNPYGNLNSTYLGAYRDALIALGYSWTNGNNSNAASLACPEGTTYAHFDNQGVSNTYDWTNLQDFRTNTDGVLLMCCQRNNLTSLRAASSPLYDYDIVYGGDGTNAVGVTLVSGIENSRIGKFLTTHGSNPIADPSSVGGFYKDGYSTSATAIPSTAVPIMQKVSDGNTMMSIDPTNRIVYMGESQIFYDTDNVPVGSLKEAFMYNFIEYMVNAARYGSHFTDLLNDEYPSLPTLWDSVWGENRWGW